MNILFLTNKSAFQEGVFGGAESSCRLLAEHFSRLGNAVHYVAKNRDGCVLPRMEMCDVAGAQLHVFHASYGYRRSRFIRKLNNWFLERHVSRLITTKKLDIAYCFYELENVQLLLRMSERFGVLKVVMRMAGIQWYEMCLRNRQLIPVYESAFNRVDAVNFISCGLQQLVREKFAELNMHVRFKRAFCADIGSSVKPGRRVPLECLLNQRFRMVMATRFSDYQKRHDVFVQAVALVQRRYRIEARLIGDGGEKHKVEKMAKELGVKDRVQFVPFLAQGELWQELEKSNLLCHACDHEGLGKIIIEGMALGLPVLASDVAPLNSFIVHGENGFLVSNDPQKWAMMIEELIDNPRTLNEVSRKSIEWVEANYSASKNIEIYISEFEDVISEKD